MFWLITIAGPRIAKESFDDLSNPVAKANAEKMLETLRTRRKALKEELVELRGAGDAAWGDVKTGIGKAWEELKTALHSASAKFK